MHRGWCKREAKRHIFLGLSLKRLHIGEQEAKSINRLINFGCIHKPRRMNELQRSTFGLDTAGGHFYACARKF
jgi:hypothetical protein